MKISKNEIENDIKAVKEIIGRQPSQSEYRLHGNFGITTIKRRWKSWNDMLMELFGTVNQIRGQNLTEIKCQMCKETFMPSSRKQKYCSKSCSAVMSNKSSPKRSKTKICKTCNNLIYSGYTYCPDCIKDQSIKMGDTPLSFFIAMRKDANRFSQVREQARKIMSNDKQICLACGYSKHVETCHKKEIQDFPETALVKEVNAKENLVLLCRNCHWELDHGFLFL